MLFSSFVNISDGFGGSGDTEEDVMLFVLLLSLLLKGLIFVMH